MHAPSLDDLLADLNEPQRQAVQHRDGPLLVLAGPGSGKTRVITRRAACLVRGGAAPWHILAITFTNKAADEMRRRIAALGVGRGMWVHTFHALGARLLREFGPLAGVQPGFTIYDDADQVRCVKDALEKCKIAPELLKPERAQHGISRAKNALQPPRHFLDSADFFEARLFGRVYEAYEQLLRQRNAVDFDDLLLRVAITLRDNAELTERLNRRFHYVLIDEYQDTNHAQYLMAQQLSKLNRNLCATGDPDQSIYGWRGADIRNILEFERDYPEATIVRLEQNYRSNGNILRVASELIKNNRKRKHKDLWSEHEAGPPVAVWEFGEGRDEAERIAETIATMRAEEGREWSDFAIFYRINAVSRGLEESLRIRGVPYKIARGVEFYNRKEIKDTLSYLRVLVNPFDAVALLRIINTPARGIGKTTIERLTAEADAAERPLIDVLRDADHVPAVKGAATKILNFVGLLERMRRLLEKPVSEAVSGVLEMSGLERELRRGEEEEGEDRLANVQELVSAAARYEEEAEEPTLIDFLSRISLASDQDAVDEGAGLVLLMTLHAAKGLEFPVVFVAGMEQGMLPHDRALSGDGDLEEERRLCFVGITRARERLFLSHASERVIRGAWLPRTASQFLGELPQDATAWHDFGGKQPSWLARAREMQRARSSPEAEFDFDDANGTQPAPRSPRARTNERWRRQNGDSADEPVFSPDDPTGRKPAVKTQPSASFGDWGVGMLVRHAMYGIGQIVWIRPGPGQTRASIKFAGTGERTFILELAPVERVQKSESQKSSDAEG